MKMLNKLASFALDPLNVILFIGTYCLVRSFLSEDAFSSFGYSVASKSVLVLFLATSAIVNAIQEGK